eukprot:13695608-Alexandrium_andersonii.AAC.1
MPEAVTHGKLVAVSKLPILNKLRASLGCRMDLVNVCAAWPRCQEQLSACKWLELACCNRCDSSFARARSTKSTKHSADLADSARRPPS